MTRAVLYVRLDSDDDLTVLRERAAAEDLTVAQYVRRWVRELKAARPDEYAAAWADGETQENQRKAET